MITSNGKILFSDKELQCKCKYPDCPKIVFADGFVDKLIQYRLALALPMNPTSVCRCAKHNKDSKGKDGSYHRTDHPISKGTCAIDFKFDSVEYLVKALTVAEMLNWSIGVNFEHKFIHMDRRVDYGQPRAYFSY